VPDENIGRPPYEQVFRASLGHIAAAGDL